jgi:inosine/xanthosine triphosphatase
MATFAVGTTNPGKVLAVKTAVAQYEKLSHFTIEPFKAASGVSDQPATLEDTMRGAKNRARGARENCRRAGVVIGIGLESGLFEDPDGRMYDLTACCFDDGEHTHVGYSCAWAVPDACARLIKGGLDMSQAANATGLCNDPHIGDKGGLISVLTGGRLTRPEYTIQSIQMALLSMDTDLYACSSAVPRGINSPTTRGPAAEAERLSAARFAGWTNGFAVGSLFVAPLLVATACALARRRA